MTTTRSHKIESAATVSARLDAYRARQQAIAAPVVSQATPALVASTGRSERLAGDVLSAFCRLVDSDNAVSLVDLRRACSLSRDAFDRQIRALRISGVLTLSNAEGRHGLSEDERAAAIEEGSDLLLVAHRR